MTIAESFRDARPVKLNTSYNISSINLSAGEFISQRSRNNTCEYPVIKFMNIAIARIHSRANVGLKKLAYPVEGRERFPTV